ncbi:caveolin-1-like [Diadema antillarum]|uniref:caveolin-1-like n=1 Tax=Diadema antillarum TaxID=105358 RepID=UPI003A85DE94
MADKQGPHATTGAHLLGGAAPSNYHSMQGQAAQMPNQPINPSPPSYVITAGAVPNTTATQHETNQEQAAYDFEDIYSMKPHVNVTHEDTFKESETAAGFPFMKSVNKNIYRWTHFALYASLTLIIGPLISFMWAVIFAVLHIFIIWFIQPCIKSYFTMFRISSMLLEASVRLFIDPIFRSMSLILSGIRGRFQVAESDINVTMKTGQIQNV